jgi:hypothetical protein
MREVESEGDLHEAPSQRRQERHTLLHHPLEVIDVDVLARRRRRIEDREMTHLASGLERKKLSICA